MVYVVRDSDANIVALSDDESIAISYAELIFKAHDILLTVDKFKKELPESYDDLYLVRYGHTYVQKGYLVYLELSSEQIIDDLKYTKDVLIRTLSLSDLKKKEIKAISKTILTMDKLLSNAEEYVPTLPELERMKDTYDPYIYNHNIYE